MLKKNIAALLIGGAMCLWALGCSTGEYLEGEEGEPTDTDANSDVDTSTDGDTDSDSETLPDEIAPWARCLQLYGSSVAPSENAGIVRDRWGRNVDSMGLLLVDWEGPMGNPETTFQVAAPPEMTLPVKMFVSVPGAPLVYLYAWSGIHDAQGPRTTAAIEYFNANELKDFGIAVNPDRDFDSETYALRLEFTGSDGASQTIDVPIQVCDQDIDRPNDFHFTRKYLDVYGDGWLDGGGAAWDYNEDGVHDGVQAKALMDQIVDDVAYYLAPWDVDTVPVGQADSHVIWDDKTVLPTRQQNTEAFNDFYLFVSLGESATGLPGFTLHTQNGEPTELVNCGVVLIDRQLPQEWVAENHVDGWHFQDGVSEDWWRSSRWNEGPSPTGDCPEGQSECPYYASSFYSIEKHELLHTLAFSEGWPRWKHFADVGCIDDEKVMAHTGQCTPVPDRMHAWNPQLHRRDWNQGVELLDDFEILVLQAVGWRLRETTPFVDLEIKTAALRSGQVGRPYDASIGVRGGVPAYRFELVSGELPPGLTLDSFHGKVTGTPTQVGSYRFEVKVSHSGIGEGITGTLEVQVE
jgi:hypothetical protein